MSERAKEGSIIKLNKTESLHDAALYPSFWLKTDMHYTCHDDTLEHTPTELFLNSQKRNLKEISPN